MFLIYSGKRPIAPPEAAELTTENFLLPTGSNVSIEMKKTFSIKSFHIAIENNFE
jgi:hypothetical protein